MRAGLFDAIAHIDLYRRYGFRHFGSKILTIHRGIIEPVLLEMARREIGLEINTSSLRRGLKEFHPSKEILAVAAKSGVRIVAIGSDAHSPDELGDSLDEAQALLGEFNLVNHVFSRRRAISFRADR